MVHSADAPHGKAGHDEGSSSLSPRTVMHLAFSHPLSFASRPLRPPLHPCFVYAPLLALLLALGSPAARAMCWIDAEHPRTADLLSVSDPRVAPLRQLARHINALLKAQPELQSLPESRMRSRWQIGTAVGVPARTLWFQARDHRREMWVGDCGVLEGADRLPARASVVVQVNATSDLFNGPPEIDEREPQGLRAWREPTVVGQVGGRPLYFGWQLVFTASGRPPWMPVTQAEYLDHVERELGRQQAEIDRTRQEAMARLARSAGAPGAGALPPPSDYVPRQLATVRAFRAGLSPEALAGPARLGWTGQHPDVPAERWPRLVKLDPAFPWNRNDPLRVQLVVLKVQGAPPHDQAMQRLLHGLDLAAFDAMLQPAPR